MKLNTKKNDLVILAGGKGSRINNYLNGLPKPLLSVNGKPFLEYLVRFYCKFDIGRVFILCGYKGYKIKKKFHNKVINFVKVHCIIEKKPMDTFGALNLIKNKLNNFYLVNGDSFVDIDINTLKLKKNKIATVCLVKNNNYLSNKKLTGLRLDKKNNLFFKKNSSLMNAGIYFFKKNILQYLDKKKQSLELDIIPKLIQQKKISGVFCKNKFIDIGTEKNLKFIKKNYNIFFKKPAVFLDRDGVLNHDVNGYTYKIKNFKFKFGVVEGLKNIIKKKFNIFLITNQAGIAKGKFKQDDFVNLQKYIKHKLNSSGIFFSDVKFCPYHPLAVINKFKKKSIYRKPDNGMIKSVLKSWIVDKKNSFMIGDSISDFKCAKKSDIKFYYAKKNFKQLISNILKKNA